MPGFDGTGPAGAGPMTGGGRGFCVLPAPAAGAVSAGAYRPAGLYGLVGARPMGGAAAAYGPAGAARPVAFGLVGLGRGFGRGRGWRGGFGRGRGRGRR